MLGLARFASSQSSLLDIQMMNQPQNQIIPGKISGDKFIVTDVGINKRIRGVLLVLKLTGYSGAVAPKERRFGELERITRLDFSAQCSSDFSLNSS